MTWQECKLINQTVDFTLPKVECEDSDNPIPYMRFVDTNKTQMITKMVCEESEQTFYFQLHIYSLTAMHIFSISVLCKLIVCPQVKSAQSCKPATSTKCASIEYQECSEAPVENCVERDVSEPRQVGG